jgi:hypothetical protein
MELAAVGADHSGVVFVDEETIVSRDIGGLVKAILVLFDRCAGWDGENNDKVIRVFMALCAAVILDPAPLS